MTGPNLPDGVWLEDPRTRQAEAPYTFFLPPPALVEAVSAGDIAKAIFAERDGAVERMWFEIDAADERCLYGTLANDPKDMVLISCGDRVAVPRTHVIDARVEGPEQPPLEHDRPREYWDRCLVDDCVLSCKSHVDYLYREEPDMTTQGDAYPDSGWRIRGTAEAIEQDRADDRTAQYVALGAVLNRDDRWLHLIDSDTGTAFQWNAESGEYEELARE